MSQAFTTTPADRRVAAIAAQCVMCGLCLPHCPSYLVTRNEAESPRGRLALMARIATGQATGDSQPSLDSCLACGRCERVCPPKVPFIEALILTRSGRARTREHWAGQLARRLARRPALLQMLLRGAVAVRAFSPSAFRRRTNLDGLASTISARAARHTRANGTKARTDLILAGCAAHTLERSSVEAISFVAAIAGAKPVIDDARCCGALDQHLGFASPPCMPIVDEPDRIVAINSGCTAAWQRRLATPAITGVASWLEQQWPQLVDRFATRPMRIALHVPCTQQGLAGEAESMRRLIDQLPGAIRLELPVQPGCCGAAGAYCMNQPAISQQLGATVAEQIRMLHPDIVVSANGGCRAQLSQALFDLGTPMLVLHPAELVADYLNGRPE